MLLQVKNLSVSFKNHRAVHGIDFQLNQGETIALVGGSGSGKSVTAQAIMQLLDSSAAVEGKILFEGQNLLEKSEKEMQQIRGQKIGMIFQDPMTSLNPTMTVGRQIVEGICRHKRIPRSAARDQALNLLKELEIGDPETRFNAYPFQLSGGMRQRVMIAIALACSPQLLIADEPTTALDATIQAQVLRQIHRLQLKFQMSLLLITHDLSVVAGICDRMIVMQEGQIVESNQTEHIFTNPQHPYTKALLNIKNRK